MQSHVDTYGIVKLDGDGRIARELPCVCGQNLRGLSPDGECPECGRPIALSLRPGVRRRSWKPVVAILSCSASLTVLVILLHAIYVARHASRSGPIELFHNLANLGSLGVAVCCLVATIRAVRTRSLLDLLILLACLGSLFIACMVSMQRV